MLACAALCADAWAAEGPVYTQTLTLPAAGDSISSAAAVTVDPGSGDILVVDQRRQRILVFDRHGLFRSEITGGEVFTSPGDLAIDREGYLFLLTAVGGKRGEILQLDFDGKLVRELVLDGLPENAEVPELASIAITPDGRRLVLLDGSNGALWISDRDGTIQHAVDLTAGLSSSERRDLRLGHVDVYGDRILAAVPSLGEVRCFDLEGVSCGVVSAGRGGQCGMVVPMAASLDGDGNYFIVDQLRMVLLKWDPATNTCLGEFYGLGSAPGYFYFPSDVVLDSQGQLYVAQAFEGRVQSYQVPSASSAEPVSVLAAIERAEPSDQEVARLEEPAEGSVGSSPGSLASSSESASAGSPQLEEALVPGIPDIRQSVVTFVEAWARAWSDQRIEDYLSAYDSKFVPQAGASRDEWERQRRRRLAAPSFIEVELSAIDVESGDPQGASAIFTQTYRSDTYRDVVVKALDLVLEDGAWKIVRETSKPASSGVLSAEKAVAAEAPALAEAPAQDFSDIRQAVGAVVDAWARAWSSQRIEDYLSAYGGGFAPQAGVSRDDWERQRRQRLTTPSFIEVELSAMRIEVVDASNASATFSQAYRSNTYRDVVVKTLDLALEDGAWKIVREVAQ